MPPDARLDTPAERAMVRGLETRLVPPFPVCTALYDGIHAMAKPATILIKMLSTADTGFYYVTRKNPRNSTEKLEMRKYDPVVRKHVKFREAKIK